MAKSNFEKVESVVGWVRDKKITGYRISKETNAREMSIIALAQGRAKVKNISFETALGLIYQRISTSLCVESFFQLIVLKNSLIGRISSEGVCFSLRNVVRILWSVLLLDW